MEAVRQLRPSDLEHRDAANIESETTGAESAAPMAMTKMKAGRKGAGAEALPGNDGCLAAEGPPLGQAHLAYRS